MQFHEVSTYFLADESTSSIHMNNAILMDFSSFV